MVSLGCNITVSSGRMRCDELRLTGSGGANRVMEAEFKRLVMRSPFDVRVEKPRREGDATLLYPFDARVAWVAACYHRTSSRISWDLCSSGATRLEPLFADLVPLLSADDRLPDGNPLRFSVDLGAASDFEASPLQLRGVVKNAIMEAIATLVEAEVSRFPADVGHVLDSRSLRGHHSLSGRLTHLACKGRDAITDSAAFCRKLIGS